MATQIIGDTTYKERVQSQLENWKDGKSIHNKIDNECCPDFSCCNKKMNTSSQDRKKFYDSYSSDGKVAAGMLVEFLGKALTKEGYDVRTSKD